MNVTYQYNRPTRIQESVIDTKMVASMNNDTDTMGNLADLMDFPVHLIVKVQVKVGFVWITIWEKHCDISDGDTRQHIINEATELQKTLEGQSNE